MLTILKKYSLFAFNNIEKAIALIIFMCTFTGAWFLFSYAKSHGVKFIDLIQTNLIISFGAFSFFIIFFIICVLLASFYFSPTIAKCLYHDILTKEKTRNRKKRTQIYTSYFIACGISSSIFFHHTTLGFLLLLLAVVINHLLVMSKKTSFRSIAKSAMLLLFSIILIVITYSIFGFLSVALNFKIESNYSLNGFLQTLFIFFAVVTLAGIGLADIHQRNRDNRNRVLCYLSFSIVVTFYISTAFSGGVSEGIIRTTGIGNKERCYYKEDLDKYSIPSKLVHKQANEKIEKLFIVADIDGKMYISENNAYQAAFLFTAKNISEVACSNKN